MLFSIIYLIFGLMCIISGEQASRAGDMEVVRIATECLENWYNTQNLLIAFGVIGICHRLNKLKENT